MLGPPHHGPHRIVTEGILTFSSGTGWWIGADRAPTPIRITDSDSSTSVNHNLAKSTAPLSTWAPWLVLPTWLKERGRISTSQVVRICTVRYTLVSGADRVGNWERFVGNGLRMTIIARSFIHNCTSAGLKTGLAAWFVYVVMSSLSNHVSCLSTLLQKTALPYRHH